MITLDDIRESEEEKRGCGFRKVGGLYLVTDPILFTKPCYKLPVSTNKYGIKQARNITYIERKTNIYKMFVNMICPSNDKNHYDTQNCDACKALHCPLGSENLIENKQKIYLLWIGKQYYPTPQKWIDEAAKQGISRKVKFIPDDIEIGKSIVAVAHSKVKFDLNMFNSSDEESAKGGTFRIKPGIFFAFRPQRIEYIVNMKKLDDEKYQKKLEKMKLDGYTLVHVKRKVKI